MAAQPGPAAPFLPSEHPVRRLVYVLKQIHPIPPATFLEFAKIEHAQGDLRGSLGALNNAKRAVTARVDALLYASGLGKLARDKSWPFPKRIQVLSEIGYSTPANLDQFITKPRNDLEHQYLFDRSDLQIQEALELAERYVSNTDKYLSAGVLRAVEFSSYDRPALDGSLVRPRKGAIIIVFDHDLGELTVRLGRGDVLRRRFSELGENVLIGIFRATVEAAVRDPSLVESLLNEEAFLTLLK
jgi:hypothetical protein